MMIISAIILLIISYGFVDSNMPFLQNLLISFTYDHKAITASIIGIVFILLYIGYRQALSAQSLRIKINVLIMLLLLSYPAFSYDIFNYIATAKLLFHYGENPYIIMPIEITNEPMLAYLRAANKVALYGPIWILLSGIAYALGFGNVLISIFSFKFFVGLFYIAFSYLIYRVTKNIYQYIFFAYNPLILVETVVNGHNDIVMMFLALTGLLLWRKNKFWFKASGLVLFFSSVLVKGATIVLIPLFFLNHKTFEYIAKYGFILMFFVFLLSHFREEIYPWYAIWWLSFAAFVPRNKSPVIHSVSFWLSLGLLLGYLPWIATRQYGGLVPVIRTFLTIMPLSLFIVYDRFKKA